MRKVIIRLLMPDHPLAVEMRRATPRVPRERCISGSATIDG